MAGITYLNLDVGLVLVLGIITGVASVVGWVLVSDWLRFRDGRRAFDRENAKHSDGGISSMGMSSMPPLPSDMGAPGEETAKRWITMANSSDDTVSYLAKDIANNKKGGEK